MGSTFWFPRQSIPYGRFAKVRLGSGTGTTKGGFTLKIHWKWRPAAIRNWGGLAILVAALAGAVPLAQRANRNHHGNALRGGDRPTGPSCPAQPSRSQAQRTASTRQFITTADGRYSFIQLPPATYTLSVKVKGFEEYQQTGIASECGTDRHAECQPDGRVGEPVGDRDCGCVAAEYRQLQRLDRSRAQSSIADLPLNTRNVYRFA